MNDLTMNLKPEVRYLSALLLGMIVTSGLFFLMQALIDSGEQGFGSSSEGQMMEFIRIKDDESLSFKDRRKPIKPKPPKVAKATVGFIAISNPTMAIIITKEPRNVNEGSTTPKMTVVFL